MLFKIKLCLSCGQKIQDKSEIRLDIPGGEVKPRLDVKALFRILKGGVVAGLKRK